MARMKDSTPTIICIKRYRQLLKFLENLQDAISRPMTNVQRRGAPVSSGRMLNSIVCVFTISNEITDRVLNSLNTMLMNITSEDNGVIMQEELEIIAAIRSDIKKCISGLETSLR